MSLWAYPSGEGQEHILGSMNGWVVRHRNKRYSAWVAFPTVAADLSFIPYWFPAPLELLGPPPDSGGGGLCLLFHSGRQDPREGVHSKFILSQVIEETQISQASWGGRLEKQVCPVGGISYT